MTTNEEKLLGKIAKLRDLLDEADDTIDALREQIARLRAAEPALEIVIAALRSLASRHIAPTDTDAREMQGIAQETLDNISAPKAERVKGI